MAHNTLFSGDSLATQNVLDALAGPTVIIDDGGLITSTNEAWHDFCQEDAAGTDHKGQSYFDVCGPVQRLNEVATGACQRGVKAVLSGALPGFRFDYARETKSGVRTYMMTVAPLTGEAGGAVISHVDVTESRVAEAKFERLLEAPIDALMVADERGMIAMVNAQMESMFGYTREELIGKHMDTLVPKRFHDRHGHHHKTYYANPHARPMGMGLDLFALRKDGSEFPVEISLTPLETDGQTLISAAIRDVSDYKKAELQVSRLGRVLESSLNEIFLFDAGTLKFTLVNRGARDNLGYSEEELAALTPIDLKPDYDKESFEALLQPLRSGEQSNLQFNSVHRRKDGTTYPVEVNLQLFKDEKPPLFAAIILDTSEREQAAQALRESERRVALHVEHTPLAVIEWDTKTRLITDWNPAAETIFSYRADEVLLKHTIDLIVPEDFKSQLEPLLSGVFDEDSFRSTNQNVTKDGRIITCEWYNTLLRDDSGKVRRVAALALDVTMRQRALEALLTAQEEERSRISRDLHDQVGQSLTAMLLGITALSEDPNEARLEHLKTVTAQTLEDVRRISRDLRPALLDELGLEAALGRSARDLSAQSGVSIDVLARLPERLERNAEIVIYRVVQEALTNILRHAEARHASVIITAGDDRVHLLVEDDGKGFNVDNLSTTDHVGLAGMKERLELLGGSLRIESSRGRGTIVSARLPLRSSGP